MSPDVTFNFPAPPTHNAREHVLCYFSDNSVTQDIVCHTTTFKQEIVTHVIKYTVLRYMLVSMWCDVSHVYIISAIADIFLGMLTKSSK